MHQSRFLKYTSKLTELFFPLQKSLTIIPPLSPTPHPKVSTHMRIEIRFTSAPPVLDQGVIVDDADEASFTGQNSHGKYRLFVEATSWAEVFLAVSEKAGFMEYGDDVTLFAMGARPPRMASCLPNTSSQKVSV